MRNRQVWSGHIHTAWTYSGSGSVASVATSLGRERTVPCRLSPFVQMSDPRIDIVKTAKRLPRGAAIVYRHFGAADKLAIAQTLRQISFERDLQFLIGQDCDLAIESGADGMHFPQEDLEQSRIWARRCPLWILTGATHDGPSLALAAHLPLDAVTLSPVFKTESAGSGEPLGLKLFIQLTRASRKPVIALGGINAATASYLIGSGAAGIAGVSGIIC